MARLRKFVQQGLYLQCVVFSIVQHSAKIPWQHNCSVMLTRAAQPLNMGKSCVKHFAGLLDPRLRDFAESPRPDNFITNDFAPDLYGHLPIALEFKIISQRIQKEIDLVTCLDLLQPPNAAPCEGIGFFRMPKGNE